MRPHRPILIALIIASLLNPTVWGHDAPKADLLVAPKSTSTSQLDAARQAARTQPHNTLVLTLHARQRMATRGVSVSRVQEAVNKGKIVNVDGPKVTRHISAADSQSGRALTVVQDVRTNNVIAVIDKGSGG